MKDLEFKNNWDGTFTLTFPSDHRLLDLTKTEDLAELRNALKQIRKHMKAHQYTLSLLPSSAS